MCSFLLRCCCSQAKLRNIHYPVYTYIHRYPPYPLIPHSRLPFLSLLKNPPLTLISWWYHRPGHPPCVKSSLSLGLWPPLWAFMTSCPPSPPGTPTSLLHLMTLALNCLGGRSKRDHYWLWFKVLILVIVNSRLHIGCTCIWPIN